MSQAKIVIRPSDSGPSPERSSWFVSGDVNGFFGLMFDNMTVLSFLAAILVGVFQFPAEIVFSKMFPGTALGVLFGNLCYTWMAVQLRRKTGNREVTAMPLGLDTPSTIGLAVTVLGPCFLALKSRGMGGEQAAVMTWQVGMATMVMVGLCKLALSFVGGWVQRLVPQAGLLGSLAGIGLVLIGFLPLVEIFEAPLIGLLALGIVLYNLVAGKKLPWNSPGVLVAVVAGTGLYYLLGGLGILGNDPIQPRLEMHWNWPVPTLGFVSGFAEAVKYLPIALPFGLLTVVGGINVTESARVAGDNYKTRDILLVEAGATLLAGLCGGVAQTTPYIGQPAYKAMGSRLGYTLATGLFIGLGGMLGFVSVLVALIPKAVLAPILIFVGLEITVQAFRACPIQHAPAVAFAFFPTVARLLQIKLSDPGWVAPERFTQLLVKRGGTLSELQVLVALGNGFILTALLWGALMAYLIDHKLRPAALCLMILAGLTFFGVIHSAMPDGNVYLPWLLTRPAQSVPYYLASAYLVLGGTFIALGLADKKTKGKKT